MIHREPWRIIDEVEFAIPEWIDWLNNYLLLASIGNIPPVVNLKRHIIANWGSRLMQIESI